MIILLEEKLDHQKRSVGTQTLVEQDFEATPRI